MILAAAWSSFNASKRRAKQHRRPDNTPLGLSLSLLNPKPYSLLLMSAQHRLGTAGIYSRPHNKRTFLLDRSRFGLAGSGPITFIRDVDSFALQPMAEQSLGAVGGSNACNVNTLG